MIEWFSADKYRVGKCPTQLQTKPQHNDLSKFVRAPSVPSSENAVGIDLFGRGLVDSRCGISYLSPRGNRKPPKTHRIDNCGATSELLRDRSLWLVPDIINICTEIAPLTGVETNATKCVTSSSALARGCNANQCCSRRFMTIQYESVRKSTMTQQLFRGNQ